MIERSLFMLDPIGYEAYLLSSSSQLNDSHIHLLSPSPFTKEHLYYLFLAHTMQTHFPFYLHFKAFDAYLILYTIEGKGKLTYKDSIYYLTPNTLIWIDCNTPFQLDLFESTSWHFNYIFFKGSHTPSYYCHYHENDYVICPISSISHVPSILNHLLTLDKDSFNLTDFIISKLITDLLTELILIKEADFNQIKSIPKYLNELKQLFDTQYMQHFNLDELAQLYHISKYKMIRDFATYLDTSPINYLIQKRIQIAKDLLLNTEKPVYEIATLVGIDNLNHFTNLFKKNVGTTPITYRKHFYPNNLNFLNE